MKIAVISSDRLPTTPPRNYAGLEVIVYTLAEGLAAMGHSVTLFALNGSETPPGCSLVQVGNVAELGNHRELILQHDAVADHSWQKAIWSLRSEHKGLVGIAIHHGPHIGFARPPIDHPCLVGLSRFHARMMQGELGSQVLLLYNGIGLRYYPLYQGPRSGRLLYVNRLHPEKSAHTHIDLAQRAGLPLDILGTEDPRFSPPEYVQTILKRCDGDRLRLWGDPGLDMKVELMQKAKALLWITPDFNEPFGMAIVESMSCGTPVIALNRGAIPELVQEGGVVINHFDEFPDALRRVEGITPEACRANAERFSVGEMCKGYSKLLQEVAKGRVW